MTDHAPVIDGKVNFDTEWRDAVVLTGCYQRDLDALAPLQAQLVFLIKLDKQFLYVAAGSPVFPTGSELRAFEKRPDHAAGIMAGDHMAVEVLPLPGMNLGRLQSAGHFAFLWNSLGTLSDQHFNGHPGQKGLEWNSRAEVRDTVSADTWETEIKIPVDSFRNATMAKHVSLPPKAGDVWALGVARRFGEAGENLFTTWTNADLVIRTADFGKVPQALAVMGRLKIAERGVAIQLRDLGRLADGKIKTDIRFHNSDRVERSVTVTMHIQDDKGAKLWAGSKTAKVGAGQSATCPAFTANPPVQERGSRLFIKIVQGTDRLLYITPGLALVNFDDATWKQYIRSLEVLR